MHNRCALEPPARIDTFGFAFPIVGRDKTGGTVQTTNYGQSSVTADGEIVDDREVYQCRQNLPGGGFVAFSSTTDSAWVEASAKRVDGSNVEALSLRDTFESAREAMREAERFVDLAQGARFEASKVIRLDAVADFDDITAMSELLNGLAAVPRMARLKVRRYQDAEANNAESLRVGPKAWNGQAYDKHAETNGEAERGRLRTEYRMHHAQLTGQWAAREGFLMRQVCDVTEDKVQRLTRATFERVSFDREVIGKASMAELVQSCEWLKPQERAQLWCYLTMPGYVSSMHRNTQRKSRAFAAELGVTMAAAEEEMADVFVRLDFDRRTEVVRVA